MSTLYIYENDTKTIEKENLVICAGSNGGLISSKAKENISESFFPHFNGACTQSNQNGCHL